MNADNQLLGGAVNAYQFRPARTNAILSIILLLLFTTAAEAKMRRSPHFKVCSKEPHEKVPPFGRM
jgi:hypothetical protein